MILILSVEHLYVGVLSLKMGGLKQRLCVSQSETDNGEGQQCGMAFICLSCAQKTTLLFHSHRQATLTQCTLMLRACMCEYVWAVWCTFDVYTIVYTQSLQALLKHTACQREFQLSLFEEGSWSFETRVSSLMLSCLLVFRVVCIFYLYDSICCRCNSISKLWQ